MNNPESFEEFDSNRVLSGVYVARVYNFFTGSDTSSITDEQVILIGNKPWQCPQDQCQAIAKARTPQLLKSTELNDAYGYPTEYTNMQIVTPFDEIHEDEVGYLCISCRCVECNTAYDMTLHRSLADDFDAVSAGAGIGISCFADKLAKYENLVIDD